ncbi:hypothetical protein T03_3576 [Trichinella britovi]|uniref:Uncharacterized protein n=1 Tax=Trichinella britovi TaxID=45882 RepID=A0A0V1AUK1_TRIBR|nr:hypothetical protein T03_3576 [Trichinella britovi]
MEELWTAESTWEAQGEETATRGEDTGDTFLIRVRANLEKGDLSPTTRHAAILSSKHGVGLTKKTNQTYDIIHVLQEEREQLTTSNSTLKYDETHSVVKNHGVLRLI